MWRQFRITTPAAQHLSRVHETVDLMARRGLHRRRWRFLRTGGVACSQRGRFGPRKLRKAAKDTKICLLARSLFVYFVGFRDLRVPTPQEPPIRHVRSTVATREEPSPPGRSGAALGKNSHKYRALLSKALAVQFDALNLVQRLGS